MPPPKKKHGPQLSEEEQRELEIRRTRLPRPGEVLGVLQQRLGASRSLVRCLDGKTRNCRIPGRLKIRLWVRERDIVLVQPWEYGGDKKGDIIFKYRKNQVEVLRKKGLLDKLVDLEEF